MTSKLEIKSKNREIKPITIGTLMDDFIYSIDLDADYQRGTIWPIKKQEELLDSVIQGIDIPKIYITESKSKAAFHYDCIDGKQRMTTLINFFKPTPAGDQPKVKIAGEKYTYTQLKKELPQLAEKMNSYELTFVIYPEIKDEEFVRDIFRRLQLGVPLNTGELLKTYTGAMRDFIYKEMKNGGPFLKRTKLSDKRFSRQFALAQICINSFSRYETSEFARARYEDLSEFFKEKYNLEKGDENFMRIKKVLKLMEKHFGKMAETISSRAIVVSAYLFVEKLIASKKTALISRFAKFYLKLLEDVKNDQELVSDFKKPRNKFILEEFQKYITQASVESYSVKRRDQFLDKAFQHYLNPKTRGKIISR